MKFAILTTGQGSQRVGMGLSWLENNLIVGNKLEIFKSVFNYDPLEVVRNKELINDTKYAQPLIVLLTTIIGDYLKDRNIIPNYYAGFSLGELPSLYLANYWDFKTLLEIIKARSSFMSNTTHDNTGMAAVIGDDLTNLEELCTNVSNDYEFVVPANLNSPNQTVISGHLSKIDEITSLLKEQGLKVIKLRVSGAFHSPLMNEAANNLKNYLKDIKFNNDNNIEVISNYTARPYIPGEEINLLSNQVISPVRWVETVNYLNSQGIYHFIEIGSGSVLNGLVTKINNENKVITINEIKDLEKLKEWFTWI